MVNFVAKCVGALGGLLPLSNNGVDESTRDDDNTFYFVSSSISGQHEL